MKDQFIRITEVEKITGLERETIRRLEKQGAFPLRNKIAPRIVAWLYSDIQRWMKSKITAPQG